MDEKESRTATAKATSKTTCQGSASVAITGQGNLVVSAPKIQASAVAFRRLEPDDPIHNLVGRVAAEWSYVEHLLDKIIWKLFNVEDHVGACITAQPMGLSPRISTILALCNKKNIDKKIIKRIHDFSNASQDLQVRRNRIMHDPWWRSGSENPFQFRSMPKKELSFGFTPINEADLREVLEKISRRIVSLHTLLKDISSELGT